MLYNYTFILSFLNYVTISLINNKGAVANQ